MNPHLALIVSEAYFIWTGTMRTWCLFGALINEVWDYVPGEDQ